MILPSVLEHYDLPELVQALRPLPVAILNPTDAMRRPLEPQVASSVYNLAGGHPALSLHCALSEGEARACALNWLSAIVEKAS